MSSQFCDTHPVLWILVSSVCLILLAFPLVLPASQVFLTQ